MLSTFSRLLEVFSKSYRSFRPDNTGTVMITGCLILPVLMLSTAAAIEYSMAYRMQTKVQYMTDAALMAAAVDVKDLAKTKNTAQIEAKLQSSFNDFFVANMGNTLPHGFSVETLEYDASTNNVHTVIAFDNPRSFYKIAGIEVTKHRVSSEISLLTTSKQPLSLVMVLDKSGSMGSNNRMGSLKAAVQGLTQNLTNSDPDEKYVRTGVVFYDTTSSGLSVEWGAAGTNQKVQGTPTGGGTASSAAMASAVNHLYGNSEEMLHSQRNNGTPRKVILFLTDGNNNKASDDTHTMASCNKAKSNNQIEIYTIAFQAPARGQALLRNCASSSEHYFYSGNAADLIAAFEKIAEFESGQLAFSK